MELQSYFEPINRALVDFLEGDFEHCLGSDMACYWEGGAFPDLQGVNLAIVGVCDDRGSVRNSGCAGGADTIRRKLYRLASPSENICLVDLGNIAPGKHQEDTQYALTDVMFQLLDRNITVIVLGGSQEFTFAQYKAYELLGRVINIVSIDSRFDLENTDRIASNSWLYHIIKQDPNYLFNFTNLCYQTYFCDRKLLKLVDELNFDAFRLGTIQPNMERAETLIRAADLLSIDLGAVRQSDCPANGNPSPHGLYGEELCHMARMAGLSDKLTSIGFFELNPRFDNNFQSAHMVAHALWYFIEGFYNRVCDFPYRDKENYMRFLVTFNSPSAHLTQTSGFDLMHTTSMEERLTQTDINNMDIVFYKSKKSNRWWMEVPCEMSEKRERYMRHLLIPCTYTEYEQAMTNTIPDLWWRYFNRVNL